MMLEALTNDSHSFSPDGKGNTPCFKRHVHPLFYLGKAARSGDIGAVLRGGREGGEGGGKVTVLETTSVCCSAAGRQATL
jgi:hypothetical protein